MIQSPLPRLEGRWGTIPGALDHDSPATVSLASDDIGMLEGYFKYSGGNLTFSTDFVSVTGEHGNGRGTLLMQAALALALDCGATEASTSITVSPAIIAINKKLFGDSMTFRGSGYGAPEIPMTVDEAILGLGGEGEFGNNTLLRNGINATSDLTGLDTSNWQRPIMRNLPPFAMRTILSQQGIEPPRPQPYPRLTAMLTKLGLSR